MSVLREGRPAGPYGERAFRNAEHDPDNGWLCEDDEGCIHHQVNDWGWNADWKRCPTPEMDGIYGLHEDTLFGFRTLDQMREWFKRKRKQLDRYGFVAAVYEVQDGTSNHGNRQSVFEWETAVRVGEASVLDNKGIAALMA